MGFQKVGKILYNLIRIAVLLITLPLTIVSLIWLIIIIELFDN